MSEKLRVLKMLEEGKISSQEAMDLLEALGDEESIKVPPVPPVPAMMSIKEDNKAVVKVIEDDFFNIPKNKGNMKMLYIRIKSSDGDNVKVTIPLEFVRMMVNSTGSLNGNLEKHNIDMDKILQAVDNGVIGTIVEIDTEDGDKVLIEIA